MKKLYTKVLASIHNDRRLIESGFDRRPDEMDKPAHDFFCKYHLIIDNPVTGHSVFDALTQKHVGDFKTEEDAIALFTHLLTN
jgi:hypothetical protein